MAARLERVPRRPLRVLAVAALPFPSPQGTQVLVGEIAESLARRGAEVHLLCYGWGAEERPWSFAIHRVGNLGRHRSLRSGPSWHKLVLDARVRRAALKLADAIDADVVLAHGHESLAAVALPSRIARPVVYHAHTRLGPELPTYFGHPLLAAAGALVGRAADLVLPPLADAIVTVCPALAAELGGTYLPPAVRLGPPPVAPRDRGHVVYTGNLDSYQGLGVLLRALRDLPRAHLTMASASDPGPTAAAATAAGVGERVRFVPHARHAAVRSLLARASVVAVPRALSTGFPVKLLEAMAAAAPMVVSRRAAHGLAHGRHALVVPDDEMALALATLLDDPGRAAALGAAARGHVEKEHDPARSAALLESILEDVVSARARRSPRPAR